MAQWQEALTKQELKHLRQMKVTSLATMKTVAKNQKKYRDLAESKGERYEPCWECKCISRKLGLPV